MRLLGVDNVLFGVGDLDVAIAHYQRLGFELRFRLPNPHIALFAIGPERPGLLLRAAEISSGGRLWVEVEDAATAADELRSAGLDPGDPMDTATGKTVEIADPWGNIVGIADYTGRPELARQPDAGDRRTRR